MLRCNVTADWGPAFYLTLTQVATNRFWCFAWVFLRISMRFAATFSTPEG